MQSRSPTLSSLTSSGTPSIVASGVPSIIASGAPSIVASGAAALTAAELRAKYLAFFARRGHVTIPPASLVPANDPSVLFTTAGMHPLVPYLLGEPHPAGVRLASVQNCIRTGDIDVVGDDTHLTLFEMLGNWSLGDYGRAEAIAWSFEFLTGELGLPLERLGVTCFAGDAQAPADLESVAIWTRLGVPTERIALLGRDDNWWGPAGKTGPCGPDTEVFYWVGGAPVPRVIDVRDRRWVEIWNNVFMSYTKTSAGALEPLARVSVDTGMGVERTLVALGGLTSVYDIDTVKPLIDELRRLATTPHERELRVLTDHVRAACFAIADGVGPANKDRGYVVRRLLRRCIVFARRLGLPGAWYVCAVDVVRGTLGDVYPALATDPGAIVETIRDEADRFERTLAQGLRVLEKRCASGAQLDAELAFDLFQTYGFPLELTRELAVAAGERKDECKDECKDEQGGGGEATAGRSGPGAIDEAGFRARLEHHRDRSRLTSGATFAGGLADHSSDIVAYHTITHLLQAALRAELGTHVVQRGSNITQARLRFDFSHGHRLAPGQLAHVEARVNGWLARELVIDRAMMTEAAARALGAIAAFGENYGEIVTVYTITDRVTGEIISRELCGGPHVASVGELAGRRFQIVKEQGISAGIRRIKAVLA